QPKEPKQAGAKPPFAQSAQEHPGSDQQMQPKPDHGEQSYRGHGRLAGRAALITGGDSGIGRAVAVAFAREGADVLISYLNEEDDAQETVRVVHDAGRTAIAAPGDISREEQCRSLVQRTLNDLGGLDILVNCAG